VPINVEQHNFLNPSTAAQCLRELDARSTPGEMLRRLRDAGLDRLPLPGSGSTLLRWRMLAAVAAWDLSLAKLYEGHTDALAILAELGGRAPAGSLWGVWCAEAPSARAIVSGHPANGARVRLDGAKAWCSGAADLSHALLSAWDADGRPWLVAVDLRQDGIQIDDSGWEAVGMARTGTAALAFSDVEAHCVGDSGAYLRRPGFWHGGAGIAACWYGAAAELARMLHAAGGTPDAHRLAHMGAADASLSAARALLHAGAEAIDARPGDDAAALAMRVRLAVDACAVEVMAQVGQALGAAPFCRDRRFARLMADLPVFLRQGHARRDQAALGQIARDAGLPEVSL